MTLIKMIEQLNINQLITWPLAADNYNALLNAAVRTVDYSDHIINLQYNPKRIISSSAKVDAKSLSERPCFLCTQNRPPEQLGIPYTEDYLLLLNPYPVFSPHFTVASVNHLPQRILKNFGAMLALAGDLPGYTLIYNGPNCGASAPDHFHFQLIRRNMLPIESEYEARLADMTEFTAGVHLYRLKDYQRQVLTIISEDVQGIQNVFNRVYNTLEESLPAADEPMMNILTWYEKGKWIIHIFPRKRHRPSQYFETGNRQILLSPASIDLGGVLIIPRAEDFEKISGDDITDIFGQVSVDDFFMKVLIDRLKSKL